MVKYYVNYDSRQYGGVEKPIFHLYTTGIGNWGSTDEGQDLIKIWIENNILLYLVDQIPINFNIHIHHYDPLKSIENEAIDIENKDEIEGKINSLIVNDKLHPRVLISEFINTKIDLSTLINPYLIVDLAHIFDYPTNEPKTVTLKDRDVPMKINSLRFGFLGDPIPTILSTLKLFDIDESGNVETWIDRMINTNKVPENYLPQSPITFFVGIYNLIKRAIENKIMELTGRHLFSIDPIIEKTGILNPKPIFEMFIKEFWKNNTDNIVEEIVENLIGNNIVAITST